MRQLETKTGAKSATVASNEIQLTWRKTLFLILSLGASVAFFAFAGGASAMRETASATPSIVSDQADYTPGATVTITGSNWGAAEAVHLFVNDDAGQSWSYTADVRADSAGGFSLQFQLPDWFIATYAVTATGASGATASTAFTDGNVTVNSVGASSVAIPWAKYTKGSTCTDVVGPPADPSSTGTVTTNAVAAGVAGGQSLRLTAPATAGGKNFGGWTGAVTSSSQTICVAGSSGSQTVTANYTTPVDTTAPVITKTITGTAGTGGWYRSDVTVQWTVSDADSAVVIDSGCGTQNFTTETAGTTSSCQAHSAGGSSSDSVTIKIDKTDPTITFASATPAANAAGWNNTDVVVSWNCADVGGSGALAASVSHTISSEGTGLSATGTCEDVAGNTASNTKGGFKIDKTDPTITFASATPAANANGWNNTDVTVKWDCADALSGPVDLSVSDVRSAEGTANASGTCTDIAGNSASAIREVKIDKTDPVVTCPPVPTFLQSQLPQTITATVTDALSGAASSTATGTANNPGGGTVSITGQDKAGNSKTVQCAYHVGNTTFLAPVDKAPTMNIAKLGRVVPVKMNLVYDGSAVTGTGTLYVGGMTKVDCTTGTATDEIEVYAAGSSNTGNLFRWDSSGPFWIYNFDTSAFKMNAGNCYRINVYYGGTVTNGTASGGALVGYFLMETTR